jgi:hypothetical protein
MIKSRESTGNSGMRDHLFEGILFEAFTRYIDIQTFTESMFDSTSGDGDHFIKSC